MKGWSFNHAITRLARSTSNGLGDGWPRQSLDE